MLIGTAVRRLQNAMRLEAPLFWLLTLFLASIERVHCDNTASAVSGSVPKADV